MITTLAFLGDFGDAVKFIFHDRPSVGGGVRVGGPDELWHLTRTHLLVSLLPILVACVTAAPLGLYLGHKGKAQFLAISVSNVGRAVPALALVAAFSAFIGYGPKVLMLALFLLAFPPILTNAYTGAYGVDREIVDAARGMGMRGIEVITKVRLPLALPTIFAGIRIAAVSVVATATIGTYASVQTLGEPIFNQQTYGFSGALGASIVVALITIVLDISIGYSQQLVTPKGLRLANEEKSGRARLALPTRRREAST